MTTLECKNEQKTLMEKWREHYAQRDLQVTPQTANIVGVGVFWYAIVVFGSLVLLCITQMASTSLVVKVFFMTTAAYVTASTAYNWFLCFNNHDDLVLCPCCAKVNTKVADIEEESQGNHNGRIDDDSSSPAISNTVGWKYCLICQITAPPRSHHCKVCNVCVLKHDHHCFFTARCIAFNTQRRFIVMTVYSFVACCYTAYFVGHYLTTNYPMSVYTWDYLIIVSIIKLPFLKCSPVFVGLLANVYLAVCIGCLSFMFILWQLTIIRRGQTTFEAWRGIRKYRQSAGMYYVFGAYWPIHFIFPIKTKLPCNGCEWPN